jgi:hypothetical protein
MELVSDRQIESRVTQRVFLIALVFQPLAAAINALSMLTEAERAGGQVDLASPWILELTSAAVLLPLVLLVAWFERLTPGFSESWRRALLFHFAGSVVFSLLHDLGMWGLRHIIFGVTAGRSYDLLPNGFNDLLYEYRKDILPYAVMVLLLGLTRHIEEARRETAAAEIEARKTGRVSVRTGGKTIFFEAADFESATAAGNYVELRTAGTNALIRLTLSRLEAHLTESGVDVVRVSRSLLLNRSRIVEVAPAADGDIRIKLADGSTLRGSRRYRAALMGV